MAAVLDGASDFLRALDAQVETTGEAALEILIHAATLERPVICRVCRMSQLRRRDGPKPVSCGLEIE